MPEPMLWFPFYVDRFLTSKRVRRMKAGHVGAYLLLLIEQWKNGAIGDDDADLVLIAKAPIKVVRQVLTTCFTKRRNGWVNDTLEDVRREQLAKLQRLKVAARAGAKARWNKGENANRIATALRPQSDPNAIREDKRREDKRRKETATASARARERDQRPRWRFCPGDWKGPTERHRELAAELHVNLAAEEAKFRDHEFERPRSDPDRSFANWLRNATQYANGTNGAGRGTNPSERLLGKAEQTADALRRMGIE